MGTENMVIGVDFDNTLVCYDNVFLRLAQEEGLAGLTAQDRQKAVREMARRSPEGDLAWQRLQGQAYGPRIQEARPFDGALAFLEHCHEAGVSTRIISHKTQFAGIDPTHTDLQAAALSWLAQNGFLAPATGIETAFFGATRQEKITHIRALGCTHFIDDLEETFREPGFPPHVQRILFAPGESVSSEPLPGVWIASSWREIEAKIFDA